MLDPTTSDYHDACLRNENPEPPIDTPQAGFYRLALKIDGVVQRVGVLFWYSVYPEGHVFHGTAPQLNWRIGRNENFTESEARGRWNFCARSAITQEAYEEWWKNGTWIDVDTAASQAIGANQAPDESLFDKLKRTLEDLWNITDYHEIRDDNHEKRAKTRVEALRSELNIAESQRVSEKAKYLAAGRAVDARWRQLLNPTSDAIETIQGAIKAYEKKILAARQVQEAACAQSDQAHQQPPPPPRKISGGIGKSATVKEIKLAVVVDVGTVAAYFKENEELKALLTKLAQRAHIQGAVVPGVRLVDDIKLTN